MPVTDDLELSIETTWIEENSSGYNQVVVLAFFSADCLSSRGEDMMKTVGQKLRARLEEKLRRDLGLEHERDYIFGTYENPEMLFGKWITAPKNDSSHVMLKLKEEEHFTMLKLHYHGN